MDKHFTKVSGSEKNIIHSSQMDDSDKLNKRKVDMRFKLEHWQIIALFLMLYDVVAVNLAYFLALWLRFDCRFTMIEHRHLIAWFHFIPVYSVFCLLIFWFLRLYKSLWRFASYSELTRVFASSCITAVFHVVATMLILHRMPISYYIVGAMIQFILILGIRFSYRFILLEWQKREKNQNSQRASRVMLIGAGSAGRMILRDLHKAKEVNEKVWCIIDDNPNKWNRFIDGVPIVGGRDTILANVKKYQIEKIFLAVPSMSGEEKRDILDICKESGCELKNIPGMYQFVTGEVTASSMKKVDIEDLLGREPVKIDMDEVFQYISGKVILVTGGGGSIGSELCRQIAKNNPKQLLIFDIYENNAYEIEQELKQKYPDLDLLVLIGSVRDSKRVNKIFEIYKPDVVYHAAAHKHVPLMEDSPCESIKNNTIGTYKTAYAAMMNGCQRFVLISTDKAVNPANIMGASKRLCEMIIQTFDWMIRNGKERELPVIRSHADEEDDNSCEFEVGSESQQENGSEYKPQNKSGNYSENESENELESYSENESKSAVTEFVAVRFGNVIGSNGSVIPKFEKQIANGGPVTVTHPDIIRYFMTISEAVSLVLQAGTYAKGGEIFVLDMGKPVKIDTIARNLIKLSGFKPDVDIKIEYIGLRPGEKLYEEKLMSEEGMRTTPNKLIYIGSPISFNMDLFLQQLQWLARACNENNDDDIRGIVEAIVPTYHPVNIQ